MLENMKNELMNEMKQIRNDNQSVLSRLDELAANISKLENKIEQVNSLVNTVSDRVGTLEQDLNDLKSKFDVSEKGLRRKLAESSTNICTFSKAQEEVEKSISFISDRFDQIEPLLANVKNLNNCSNEANMNQRLHKMEAELNREQQQTRNKNLIISGLVKTTEPEKTFWGIVDALGCSESVARDSVAGIEILHAKRPRIEGKSYRFFTDTMLVKFRDSKSKIALIKRKKAMGVAFADSVQEFVPKSKNDTRRPREVFFRDHLTEFGMRLYAKSREVKDTLKFKYLWTIDGQIFMKEYDNSVRLKISSFFDLEQAKNAHPTAQQ